MKLVFSDLYLMDRITLLLALFIILFYRNGSVARNNKEKRRLCEAVADFICRAVNALCCSFRFQQLQRKYRAVCKCIFPVLHWRVGYCIMAVCREHKDSV